MHQAETARVLVAEARYLQGLGIVVQEAEMEGQQAEIGAILAPEGLVAAKPNLATAVIGQVRELGPDLRAFGIEGLIRKRDRQLDDILVAETLRRSRWRLGVDDIAACQQGGARQQGQKCAARRRVQR